MVNLWLNIVNIEIMTSLERKQRWLVKTSLSHLQLVPELSYLLTSQSIKHANLKSSSTIFYFQITAILKIPIFFTLFLTKMLEIG